MQKAGLTEVVYSTFPIGAKRKKHPWDRIPRSRFHTTILGGLFREAENAGLTKVVQLRLKLVFSSFHIRAKRKNTLGIEFHEVGFIPPFLVGFCKQRKKPGWRRSSNSVQNSFFRLSPSRRNEESPLESNLPISVSYHHFCRAFASTAKSRVDEGRPIALKPHFFDFSHRCETKKHTSDRIPRGRFHTTIFGGLLQAAQKAGLTKFVQLRWKLVFSSFPIGAKRKNTLGIQFHEACFIPPFWVGFSKQRKTAGWRRSSNCVQNSFFDFRHHGETKNHPWNRIYQFRFHTTIFGGLSQASKKAGLTKVVRLRSKLVNSTFPIGGNRKKHPWDRIPRGRFHSTIFAVLLQAVQKAGLTKVVQLRSKLVYSTFPIGAKRKNTFGIEFHEVAFILLFWLGFCKQWKKPGWRSPANSVQNTFFRLSPSWRMEKTPLGSNSTRSVSYEHFGWAFPSSAKSRVDEGRPIAFKTRFFDFPHRGKTKKHPWIEFNEFGIIPPFWESFWKQRKKPGWRRSSNCVQNSFFRLSQSGRNEKTPFGSNSTRSVSYDHFGWAFPSSAKSRVDEGRPIAFKTRFFDFPHRGKLNEKTPLDRIQRVRYHTTILGGLYQGAENAGLTKNVQLRWKLVFSSFPIWAKRKNTLGIEFHQVGFITPFWVGFTKQRKTPGWRSSSNWVENSFCRVFPSGRNKKTPLGSNSTRSVSYQHFCWALASSAKRRVDEGRPFALKTRFFDFPRRSETKKHPWDRIPRGRFHTTILGWFYQAEENAGLTKVVQLRSKLVFSTFPIGAKRKSTLGIDFHEVGFIPPFWVGFTKQRKTPGWRSPSNWVENSFFRLSPSERNEKTHLGSNSTRSVSHHHFGLDLPSSGKSRVDEGVPVGLKTRFVEFPHQGETKKKPLGSNSMRSVSYHHFFCAFACSPKSRVDEGRPIALKTRFVEFPHRGETKKHPWVRIPRGRFHTTIFAGLYQAAENAGLTKVVQLRSKLVLSSFPIGAKRKNTLGFEFHEVGFIPPFLLGFTKQRKTLGWRRSSNCVQNSFCRVSPSGRNEKTPLWSNSTRSVSYHHFGWDFPSSAKRRFDQGRPIGLKTRFVEFPHRDGTKKHPWDQIPRGRFHTTIFAGLLQAVQKGGLTNVVQLRWKLVFSSFPIGAKRKNTLWIEFHEVGFIPPFWVGFSQQRKTPGWRRSSNCVQNSFFRLSTSGQNEKTPLGSNSTRSVSYHHFGVDLPISGKRWVDEGRPIAFKTRFFEIPHRGKTKKHPWDRIPRVWFQTTIMGRLLQAAQKASCVVLRVQCTVSSAESTVHRV